MQTNICRFGGYEYHMNVTQYNMYAMLYNDPRFIQLNMVV